MTSGVLTATATITCGDSAVVCDPIYLTLTDGGYSSSAGSSDFTEISGKDSLIEIWGDAHEIDALLRYGSSPSWSFGLRGQASTDYFAVAIKYPYEHLTSKTLTFETDLPDFITFEPYSGSMPKEVSGHPSDIMIPILGVVSVAATTLQMTGRYIIKTTDSETDSLLITVLFNQ